MKGLLFSIFLTLGILFFFIAGISMKKTGFKVAIILGVIFLYLALIFR
jgi:uncharacterized membrane protein